MTFTTRIQRKYDHRLREFVRSTGDAEYAIQRGVPRSTARGWLTSTRADCKQRGRTEDGTSGEGVGLQGARFEDRPRSSADENGRRRVSSGVSYNVQFATTTDTLVIVGADVTNAGSDGCLMSPMVDQIEERHGTRPDEYLADGGFSTLKDIEALESSGTQVYAPVKDEEKKRKKGEDPFGWQNGDSDEVAAWRRRMGTESAKRIYKQRAATAEFPNAGCRNRGLLRFLVRGRPKAKAVSLWQALQPVEKWRSDQLLNVSRSEAPLAFKTWITVLASENISRSQFVARQRFGRTGLHFSTGCLAHNFQRTLWLRAAAGLDMV